MVGNGDPTEGLVKGTFARCYPSRVGTNPGTPGHAHFVALYNADMINVQQLRKRHQDVTNVRMKVMQEDGVCRPSALNVFATDIHEMFREG